MRLLSPFGDDPFPSSAIGDWFPVIFGVAVVVVLAGIGYTIYAAIRNRRKLREAGHDPDTIQADLVVRAMQSGMLAPNQASASTEERLAEIDRLHESGAISAEERIAARMQILGGPS